MATQQNLAIGDRRMPPQNEAGPPRETSAPPPTMASRWLIALLGALVAFAPLTVDMYLPALPLIAAEYSAGAGAIQFTLAIYFIGMAVGQSIYGPLSDRFGRKPPLYVGLVLYVVASVGCATSANVEALLAWRFLQALGGSVGVVVPLAIVRDRYGVRESAQVLSRLILAMGLAPILAPLLGAQLLASFGWRSIFWVLAACGLAALLAVRGWLLETLATGPKDTLSVPKALRTYAHLLADRHYLGYALSSGFASAGMFAYIVSSPFVLITVHKVSPALYAVIFGANAVGLILASQINHRLLAHMPPERILALLGGLLVFSSVTGIGGLGSTLVLLFLYIASLGLVTPNASAQAMAGHGRYAGSASALLGTLRFALATLAGFAVAAASAGGGATMGIAMAACSAAALLLHVWLCRRNMPDAALVHAHAGGVRQ